MMKTQKSNKNINRKANLSQQKIISPLKVEPIDNKVDTPRSPRRATSSPDKKRYMMDKNPINNADVPQEIEKKEKELTSKKEKLCACINLFNLMQSNNMQLRCSQHNNILTLYCLTERKVLCVNCNYGDFKHKTHKILPLKDSNSYINEDNILLKEILNKDLKEIEQSIRNCQQNTNIFQNQLKAGLLTLERQFVKNIDELKSKYDQQTQKLKKTFSIIINKSKNLQKDIEQYKFKIWETISKIGIGKRNQSVSNQTQIVRQVFCSNIADITRFEIRKVNKKDIEKLIHKAKFC